MRAGSLSAEFERRKAITSGVGKQNCSDDYWAQVLSPALKRRLAQNDPYLKSAVENYFRSRFVGSLTDTAFDALYESLPKDGQFTWEQLSGPDGTSQIKYGTTVLTFKYGRIRYTQGAEDQKVMEGYDREYGYRRRLASAPLLGGADSHAALFNESNPAHSRRRARALPAATDAAVPEDAAETSAPSARRRLRNA